MAAGPHKTKSDVSRNSEEFHWRTNSTFSPPLRIWDCRSQSEGLPYGSDATPYHYSLSSISSSDGKRFGNERYGIHHHSVSDSALSYSESPIDNLRAPAPRWTSPARKFNLSRVTTASVEGSRSEISWFPHSSEKRYTFGSPSSLHEPGKGKVTAKQQSNCNPHRRPFISKPVYPLVIHNPVSEYETFADTNTSRMMTLGRDTDVQSCWPDTSSSIDEHSFYKALSDFQTAETSPEPSTSSRREGFRCSSPSSYLMGLEGDAESPNYCHPGNKKCRICGKLLSRKSPWGSYRMVSSEMPIAGILPCSHVFHAECLEHLTPKTHIHDPPCPLCFKTIGPIGDCCSFSQYLHTHSREVDISNGRSSLAKDLISNDIECGRVTRASSIGSLKNRLKRNFLFKGNMGREKFYKKVSFWSQSSASSGNESVRRGGSIS